MDIEVAGGVADARDVEAIVPLVDLADRQHVLESPDLVSGAQPERLGVAVKPHGAIEGPLEDRRFVVVGPMRKSLPDWYVLKARMKACRRSANRAIFVNRKHRPTFCLADGDKCGGEKRQFVA